MKQLNRNDGIKRHRRDKRVARGEAPGYTLSALQAEYYRMQSI